MAVANVTTHEATTIDVPWWSVMVVAAALLGSYLMLQDTGWLTSHWMVAHELFHDARHALGMPCH